MRLRRKYVLILCVVVVVLGGVVLGSTELFKQQTIAQEQSELNQTTNQTALQVQERLDNQRQEIETLAATPGLNSSTATAARLDSFLENSDFLAIQVIAPNGTIVDFRGQISAEERRRVIGRDVSNRTYVRSAVERGESYVRAPEHLDGSVHLVLMSVPIIPPGASARNGTSGALVGAVEVGQSPSGSASSDVLGPLQALETETQTARVTAAAAEEDGRAVLQPVTRVYDERLTASAGIETGLNGPEWTLTVVRDRRILTERLRNLQVIQGVSLLVVLLSMVGLGVWQYRTNLRQTERLLDGFDALTRGEFEHELSLASAQEWEQISEGFNELGAGLLEREREIAEREKQMSVLNRVLRHNIQNDLTVIQGYAEMLPEFEGDQLEDAADTITAKVEGLVDHAQKARRIEDALESAEEGTQEIEVTRILDGALAEYAEEYPDATVESDLPEEQYVSAIQSLSFAVENLVENAFEHNTGEDPRVVGAIERTAEGVAVVVEDNGPGIPAHEYEVLEQEAETSLEHGSGIGLWLAYWVVEKSGGSLRFETSEARDGEGEQGGSESAGTRAIITLAAGDDSAG
jgi:signal transduction histidine kinase